MKSCIIGMGEVGKALSSVLEDYLPDVFDINWTTRTEDTYDILHICFPFERKEIFEAQVKRYQEKYKPKYTIIHSTVEVGTCRPLNAIHSPIRGQHPNLEQGIRTFPKFLGGEQASEVADYFRRAGLKIILCEKQETTELMKLLDTEYYRTCIEFTKKAKELCDRYEVPFAEAMTLANITYNEGYKALGFPEYQRPVLQPIKGPLGGHCLENNSKMI
jgi:hypothetical protein